VTTNHSRRSFLKTSATAAAVSLLPSSSLRASIAGLHLHAAQAAGTANARRLSTGWEYLQATLGGPWEALHSEEVAVWQKVAMPHCFNAYDGCDPDVPCYRGNGWYRTYVPIANPYPNGRTLLHFEGAGQTTTVYIGEKLAGKHVGGYDEFVFDVTDILPAAAPAALAGDATPISKPKTKKPDGVPIAILCDNSRDLDRMPSDFSDFTLYGGLYRHVNLVYVPAVSF
jgi:beta-galactosidase